MLMHKVKNETRGPNILMTTKSLKISTSDFAFPSILNPTLFRPLVISHFNLR